MNRQITSVAGRTPARRKTLQLEDFNSLLEFRVLSTQPAKLEFGLRQFGGSGSARRGGFGPSNPGSHCFGLEGHPFGDRADRFVFGGVVVPVIEDEADRLLANLVGGVLLRHEAYLPKNEGVHQTRDGS